MEISLTENHSTIVLKSHLHCIFNYDWMCARFDVGMQKSCRIMWITSDISVCYRMSSAWNMNHRLHLWDCIVFFVLDRWPYAGDHMHFKKTEDRHSVNISFCVQWRTWGFGSQKRWWVVFSFWMLCSFNIH